MSFTLQSPTAKTSIEQKIKARNCALILKHGSPKLRDLLRQRCRSKMKESRANAFSNSRNIPMERKQLINEIVREELANEIDNDIELHEIILKEIYESWESWQNEEYELSMQTLMEFEDQSQIFCPVCERHLLNLQENIISCECGIRLYYPKTLTDFFDKVQVNLKTHDLQNCAAKLVFFPEPKVGFNVLALNAVCLACDYYSPIIELM